MIIFPETFDSDMLIEQVHVADEITLTLRATSSTASCPNCGTISGFAASKNRKSE